MNTIIAAIGAAILAILGAFGYSRVVKAKAAADVAGAKQGQVEAQKDAAEARTQTAEVRDAQAQSNAAAAQQGAEAAKERNDVEQQVSGADSATLDGLVQKWAAPESGDTGPAAGTEDRR